MKVSISQQLADELIRPSADPVLESPPDLDVTTKLREIERRQREVHAAVLELRALVEDLRARCLD